MSGGVAGSFKKKNLHANSMRIRLVISPSD